MWYEVYGWIRDVIDHIAKVFISDLPGAGDPIDPFLTSVIVGDVVDFVALTDVCTTNNSSFVVQLERFANTLPLVVAVVVIGIV